MSIFGAFKLKEEINSSNEYCAKVKQDFDAAVKIYRRDFEMIQEDYSKTVENVREQFAILECLNKIYFELETSAESFSKNQRLANLPEGVDAERITIGGEKSILSGLGAGLGVGKIFRAR